MTGAQQAADSLHRLGVEVVFSVSGNQILPLFDVLPEARLKIVHARHENAAAYMAEAWGQLRGQPGVCLLTAGPGVASAVTAVANAQASESPVLLLSGASPASRRGLGAFQEMDQVGLLTPFCKAAWSVDAPDALGAAVEKAWRLAASGVPGPVYLSLPVDVLEASGKSEAAASCPGERAEERESPRVSRSDTEGIATRLMKARRPVAVVRPALRRGDSADLLGRLERRIPTLVAESPRGLRDPLWGERGEALRDADVVLLLGPRDFAVGFGPPAGAGCAVLQVTSTRVDGRDPVRADRAAPPPEVRLEADEAQFLSDLLPLLERALPVRAPLAATAPRSPLVEDGLPHPLAIAEEVRQVLTPDDLLVVDGGEFGQWMRAGFRDLPNRQLVNGKLGAIGNSIPQAIGAALAQPGRRVFAFLGDGTFSYHAAELDTAVREGLPILVLIGNDGCYGAEWHAQRTRYGPDRTYATALERRRYELVAEGYGAVGMAAESRAELRRALSAAVQTRPPAATCINVQIRSLPSAAAGA